MIYAEIFAGGEWGSDAVIIIETAPKEKRGILSGFLQSGFNFNFVIVSLVFFEAIDCNNYAIKGAELILILFEINAIIGSIII